MRRDLASMRVFQAPNLVILTRSADPPIPGFRRPEKEEGPGDELPSVEAVTGNKRELCGMSRASSLAFARVLSTLDWSKNGQCLHVSLTYGRTFPRTKDDLALAKNSLPMWFVRAGCCGFWRLEYQKRNAPHWHVLAWIGDADPCDFETKLRSWWAECSGNKSFRGVKVTSGDQARGTWYLALHAAKRSQSPPFRVGRWWGFIDRARVLAAADLHCTGEISDRERVWWTRLYRRATGGRTRNVQGVSWFLPRKWQCSAAAWIREKIDTERASRAPRPPLRPLL